MRKTLLIITLALISSMTMMANYNFKFCGGLYTATGLDYYEGQQMRVSLDIPADMATQLAGNEITEICFGWASERNMSASATVFVMENGEYVSTGNIEDAALVAQKLDYAEGFLDTPYTIKENTPFTFGYIMDDPISGLYPIGLSQTGPALFSGKVEILDNGSVVGEVSNIADATGGYTGFLYAVSTGDKDALLNYVIIEPDGYLLPTVEEGDEVTLSVKVLNLSSKYVNPIKFSVEIGGNTTEFEYTRRINAGASKSISFSSPAIPAGRNDLNVKVVEISGEEPATQASFCAPIIGLAADQGFKQMMVVEEGTGTWCGYCPRGIVGMDYMTETYPDDFIGICVHGGNDPFVTNSYNGLDKFITGYPGSVTNRQPLYVSDPDKSNLEKIYKEVIKNRSAAQISLEVVNGENKLYAVSTTNFAFEHFCSQGYKVAFVIIENGLVGAQTNYYSGQSGSLEWWDKQRSTVVWTYSDTARDIFDFDGLDASLMNDQISTSPYSFQATLPLTNVKNVGETAVIALLLDDQTGVIMNACRVYYNDYKSVEETGVSNVVLDNEDVKTISYYTISGQKVENPQHGQLYIEALSNGKAIKRIFK